MFYQAFESQRGLNNISACGQHRLIKVVPKKLLNITLLFINNICKLSHLHIHEYSLLFLAKIHKKSGNIAVLDLFVFYFQNILENCPLFPRNDYYLFYFERYA